MDNIGELLSSLNDEDIENLKGMAKELFSADNASGTALPDMLSGIDPGLLTSLLSPAEDERTKLIQSLKPLLSEERRHRADEAVRLLHLISLLPALKQSGILDKFLGDSE